MSIQINNLIQDYDTNNITIGALGSHSALDICRGAKDEQIPTLVICQKGRDKTYSHYYKSHGSRGIVDEVLVLDKFDHLFDIQRQEQLHQKNTIIIPHRSFQVYLSNERIEHELNIPLFGNRFLLKAEERTNQNNQYDLLRKASIPMPLIFSSHKEIDRLCIVKISEKQRAFERAFFYCSTPKEFEQIINKKLACQEITQTAVEQAVIEEYVIGALVNFNFFYSPLHKTVELLGTDTRRQTNLDGMLRLTAQQQNQLTFPHRIAIKLEEVGHYAVTVLESLLEQAFELAERLVTVCATEYPPGIIGPFALQTAITPGPPKKEIVVFDVSLRMPGSPGTFATPYSAYLYGKQISVGRRVAMEIKEACAQNRLREVVT